MTFHWERGWSSLHWSPLVLRGKQLLQLLEDAFKSVGESLYLEKICLQCVTLMLVGMSVNLALSPPSLWSLTDMTNTWRIHKACQILSGRFKNPVADLLFWSLVCLAVCLINRGWFQQGSLMWECIAEEETGTLENGDLLAGKSMVIMSGRCSLLSLAESGLLERTHGVWFLLRPVLSMKSSLHLDVCLMCVLASPLSYCVLIWLTKTGEIHSFLSTRQQVKWWIDATRQHIDQTMWNLDVPWRVSSLAHTGVVSVIDLLRKTTVHCGVWFIRYPRWCFVLIRIPHSLSQSMSFLFFFFLFFFSPATSPAHFIKTAF